MPAYWIGLRAVAAAFGISIGAQTGAAPSYFESLAMVQGGDIDESGNSWFETWDEGMRFVLEAKYKDRSEPLWDILRSSKQTGLSATIRFDVSQAHFDPKLGSFLYPICSVELSGQRFVSPHPCDKPDYEPRTIEDQVAVAVAELANGSPRAAIGRLDKVLLNLRIRPELVKRALAARAESYTLISDDEVPDGEAADRATLGALADYRRLTELAPDINYYLYSVGLALQRLGDYASARSIFEQVQKQRPQDDFNNTLSLATLEREAGNAERSLTLLNGLVQRNGPQKDMRYNYHRGWTLNALGRYDEAILTLTTGLKDQPDYAYAYLRRACAYAGVGRLSDAANDLDSAAHYFTLVPQMESDQSVVSDLAHAQRYAARLRAALAIGDRASHPEVCHGLWGENDRPREKSALLPQ